MSKKPLRRSQAIAPFGVGALVDFPGPVSLVHASLDAWPFDHNKSDHRQFMITDEDRLCRRIGVSFLVQPPDYREPVSGNRSEGSGAYRLMLPFLRFPRWHVCPRCGLMRQSRYHDSAAPRCVGPVATGGDAGKPHVEREMVQVRFVAACKHGHLQDFPWIEWLYEGKLEDYQETAVRIRMRGTGSASLGGVEISSEKIGPGVISTVRRRSLAGAFGGDPGLDEPSALSKVNAHCTGANPVLAIPSPSRTSPGCGQHLYPLLRGASNLYFAHTVSSIFIPDTLDTAASPAIRDLLEDDSVTTRLIERAEESDDGLVSSVHVANVLSRVRPDIAGTVNVHQMANAANSVLLVRLLRSNHRAWGFLDQTLKASNETKASTEVMARVLTNQFPLWRISPATLAEYFNDWYAREAVPSQTQQRSADDEEREFRRHEFNALRRDIDEGFPKRNLLIRSHDISAYGREIQSMVSRISLVHKLRETRAFCGFSRIFPENDLSQSDRWKLLATAPKDWLPATIVRGEGIFLEFREERIGEWLVRNELLLSKRLAPMQQNLVSARERRHQQPILLSPRFVMLHTLAHTLINQLVYECGYGSASLRERIYSHDGENPMAAILIYTAAGDSEGTMGGLVRMGEPGQLEGVLARAIEKAKWCSSDPTCIESRGQGPDSCNLAACHACALLPETSCEAQNRMLDRATVIGTLENVELGFVSSALKR